MAALATSGNRDPVVAAKAPRAEVVQVADQLALRIQVGDGPVTWIPLGEAMTEVA
nr:hypothetical protein [Luteibacter rhizovicinus]